MKDSTATSSATTILSVSPTATKEKTTSVFRDTRAELAQLLKKKEEIEVC